MVCSVHHIPDFKFPGGVAAVCQCGNQRRETETAGALRCRFFWPVKSTVPYGIDRIYPFKLVNTRVSPSNIATKYTTRFILITAVS
jgi:hypothetical protein